MNRASNGASPGLVYLAATNGDTFNAMVKRALAEVRARTGNPKPRVAVSYAAVAESLPGRAFMKGYATKTFWGAHVETFHVAGEHSKMDPAKAKAIVDEADIVFLSGGDPVLGARLLCDAGADVWLRDARARGTTFMGVSAGAMMLCSWWASWPDDPPQGAPWDGGALVRCTNVASDLVLDCHAEEDDWAELKTVDEMLRARAKNETSAASTSGDPSLPRRIGLATPQGIVIDPSGAFELIGGKPFEIA